MPSDLASLGAVKLRLHTFELHASAAEAFLTKVFDLWLLDRPETADFWGLGGPGGRENPFKGWSASVRQGPYLRSRLL